MARPGASDGITEASVLMQDHIGEPHGGDDLHVDGVTSEAAPAPDIYGMTAYDRATFGLQPHETYISVRDWESPEWKRTDPGRFRQVQALYQGQARRLEDEHGNPARPHLPGLSDQVLVAVPRALHEALTTQQERETQAYLAETDAEHSHREGSFDRRNPDHIEEAVAATRAQIEAISEENRMPFGGRLSQGIVGNTEGMSLEEALARIPKEVREEEARRYREGARYSGLSDEQFAEAITGGKPRGKTYGVGRGLGNENPNSALAQTRNRTAREQSGQRR